MLCSDFYTWSGNQSSSNSFCEVYLLNETTINMIADDFGQQKCAILHREERKKEKSFLIFLFWIR
jgi:hypothetical protein